jgi:RHS repeat-associated protein
VVLYAGYRFDAETGLYHVRHRMYHATLGRWLQRDPIGYEDGMGLYEYARSSPIVHLDPLGQGVLDEAFKQYLQRVFGAKPYLLNPRHPTTWGPGPVAGGALWGLIRGYADAGTGLDHVAERVFEFVIGPQAAAMGTCALYHAIPGAVTSALSKGAALAGRTGLYAAAFYAGFRVGAAIGSHWRDLGDQIEFNKLHVAKLDLMRSRGMLFANRLLDSAPEVCCNNEIVQLSRTNPRGCGDQLVRRFEAAFGAYGASIWDDVNGATYEEFKARKGTPGAVDPDHAKRLADRLQRVIDRYFQCVKKHCEGKVCLYEPE